MKILRIIYDWPPPWNGLSPHPYELTQAQVELGNELTVFCGRWPRSGPLETIKGVNIKTFIREPIPGTLEFTTSLYMFISYLSWRRSNTPDIIHSHGHFGVWIYLYRSFLKNFFPKSKELLIPLVVHFHNTVEGRKQALIESGKNIKLHSRYISYPLQKLSDQTAVDIADALVFTGEELKQQAITYYKADTSKAFVIESGVNTNLFKPVGPEELEKSRAELGFDPMDKVILYLSNIVERKNTHVLIEALSHLPNIYKLFLVGPGDKDYIERITKLITELKLEDRVVRTGYVPYLENNIAYQISNVFVLPSDFEGIPKVVIQSLASGVPVLASGFKLNQNIQGMHYIENKDPQELANRIRELVEGTSNVDLSTIQQNYSWHSKALEMQKVYDYAKSKYIPQ